MDSSPDVSFRAQTGPCLPTSVGSLAHHALPRPVHVPTDRGHPSGVLLNPAGSACLLVGVFMLPASALVVHSPNTKPFTPRCSAHDVRASKHAQFHQSEKKPFQNSARLHLCEVAPTSSAEFIPRSRLSPHCVWFMLPTEY